MSLAALEQAALICGFSWLLWKYFRQVFIKSPLDNIPGPPRESLLFGEITEYGVTRCSVTDYLTGNLRQILERHAWPVYQHLTEAYPGIVKLAGPLGVCFTTPCNVSSGLSRAKTRMLYVFDPVAMHSIIVKDQYVFEEAAWFIM